ncbi:uncharacterized protein LOC132296297 [Cornus florida]|uniref:uncharacterized protein LOC132296297 n=1 Tax=Cornus florida TaxID=4283 RepID=UPI00289EBBB6|nr:uncharacterized protein LOC132296297 [Cornus florida]
MESTLVSRTLYLVDPESSNKFVHCDRRGKMKLETKLKIPLRNVDMLRAVVAWKAQKGCLPKGSPVKRKCRAKFYPRDYVFNIVNSCNGFLCLSELIYDKPVVVCNPITGRLTFPTYLNGGLYWVCQDGRRPDQIVSFNFDDELFQSVPLPPLENGTSLSMGVLEGCLCISDC